MTATKTKEVEYAPPAAPVEWDVYFRNASTGQWELQPFRVKAQTWFVANHEALRHGGGKEQCDVKVGIHEDRKVDERANVKARAEREIVNRHFDVQFTVQVTCGVTVASSKLVKRVKESVDMAMAKSKFLKEPDIDITAIKVKELINGIT